MTNSKHTKKAWLASMISMMLCVAMLIGSTFAWFTDTASTGVNKIQAGNLDVELEYWNGEKYVSAQDVKLFKDDALWEPGHTEVAYLRVRNAGSLALKYKLAVNPDVEQVGINMAGEQFKLSDHLVFKAVDGKEITAEADKYTRETAKEAAGAEKGLKNFTAEKELLKENADYIALVVYMPESVGNEANYKTGTDAPYIQLSVQLVATQSDEEVDSFDSLYDKDATYPFEVNGTTVYLTQTDNGLYKNADDETDTASYVVDQASMKALSDLTNTTGNNVRNEEIVLAADIDMEGKKITPISAQFNNAYTGTFDGAGHTISNVVTESVNYGNGLFAQTIGADFKNLTVENITIGQSGRGNIVGGVVGYTHGNTTFENVHVNNCTVQGYGKIGGILGSANEPDITTTFINCSVKNTKIVGEYNCAGLIGLAMGTVNVDEATKNAVDVTWEATGQSDKYETINTTIECDGTAASCPGNGVSATGQRWEYSGYYYAAYAKYYVLYGDPSHDCALADGKKLANSELCIDVLN